MKVYTRLYKQDETEKGTLYITDDNDVIFYTWKFNSYQETLDTENSLRILFLDDGGTNWERVVGWGYNWKNNKNFKPRLARKNVKESQEYLLTMYCDANPSDIEKAYEKYQETGFTWYN